MQRNYKVFRKVRKQCACAIAESLRSGQTDAWGIVEGYRMALSIREQLAATLKKSYGYEYGYIETALEAVDGRLLASYEAIRDTLGAHVATSVHKTIEQLKAEIAARPIAHSVEVAE